MKENILTTVLVGCIVLITLFTGVGAFGEKESSEASLQGASFINDFPSVSRSTSVTVGPDTSMEVAPANVARQYLVISNKSANSVYLNLGSEDATQTSGILVSASSTYTINADALYTGAIQAVASATGTVLVTEK